jgi:intracellular multiplication protein IcmO
MAIRGLEAQHEQDAQALIRDTRTLGQRVADFFKEPAYVGAMLCALATVGFTVPALTDLALFAGLLGFWYAVTRKATLPFRMPQASHLPDYNDPLPGSDKPRAARGISYFGNDRKTQEELWFNNDDMRTHVLIFGSTGSGKTEALASIAFNSLVQGSGFIYIDGKGDTSLFAKIFSMCRRMGREDDLLLINFMTGARDIYGAQEKRLSNTMNPFSAGSSSMLSQLVISLMPEAQGGGGDDMWKGRAMVFVEAVMKILVYMRDHGHILLDANTIRQYFDLPRLEAIIIDKQFIRDKQEPVDISDIPELIVEPITNYVTNLPGFDRSKKGKQGSGTLEQHGFITMQLTRVFGSLADTYSHIIRTNLPEVDMKDIVLNRRILVVLLPALEKAPDELSNLGKVIVSTLKAMMASGLGEEVEGTYRDLIERKPTTSPTPFVCIMDEYGYYAVKGFAVVPAQARSLGFSAIFAGQDLPAFQKASKEEALSIGANTNIKICMKLEDPMDTWEFFQKTAGEAYVTKVDSFQMRPESMTNTYRDNMSSSSEKRARIDLLDLKDQREGEAHIFFKSKIIRAKMFYAAPPPAEYMRLNYFVKVEPTPTRILLDIRRQMSSFSQALQAENFFVDVSAQNEEIDFIAKALNSSDAQDPIVRSVQALTAFYNHESGQHDTLIAEDVTPVEEMHIFAHMRSNDILQGTVLVDDIGKFGAPLLDRVTLLEQSTAIERLSGRANRQAAEVAAEVVKDMQIVTHYPPENIESISASEIAEEIQSVIYRIKEERALKQEVSSED